MAYAKIVLTNGVEIKAAPVGYSWTTLFLGGWPALFRQDWLWGIGGIIGSMITYGVSPIVVSFFYNKVYINNLLNKGYVVMNLGGLTEDALKVYLGRVSLPNR